MEIVSESRLRPTLKSTVLDLSHWVVYYYLYAGHERHVIGVWVESVYIYRDHRVVDDHVQTSLVQPQDRFGDSLLTRLFGERKVERIVAI